MSTNQNKYQKQVYFMRLALLQAKKAIGNTNENPSVGCVIVKENNLISAGHTSFHGRPHAEVNAINFSKKNTINSHLYSTLEPCSNHGKTPPCVNSIIKAKIKKVFFSIKDPDIKSYGKSFKKFRNNKIIVNKNLLNNEIKKFYKSYIISKSKKLPFVTCKLAITRDYFMVNKKKKWITNLQSRGRVHLLRSIHDCLLTSSSTIIKDNPKLTCRINGLFNLSPARVILDNKFKISIKSNIVKDASKIRTIIFYNKENIKKIKFLKKKKVKLYKIPLDKDKNLDLTTCLFKIKELGFSRVFLESGFILTKNFFKKNLVNELKVFMSNEIIGANGKFSTKSFLKQYLQKKKKIIEKVNLSGEHLTSYYIK